MSKDRLYYREGRGYYMDLRDLGAGRKACVPKGKRSATKDRDEASRILATKLDELEEEAATKEDPQLEAYARYHLEVKAQYRKESTVARDEVSLRNLSDYFGGDTQLSEIGVQELTEYLTWRRQQPGSREGTTVSAETLLSELSALSSLYKRAVAEGKAKINPVRRLPERPRPKRTEREWLEPGEAARILQVARAMDRNPHPRAVPFLHPLFAGFLYTGGRAKEVFGLLARDIDTENDVVHIRPNRYRDLKHPHHRRYIPLWPDLKTILTAYLEANSCDASDLLFPSPNGGMLSDVRGSLSSAVERAKVEKHVTPHTFRHTYAATRMQTTDHGAPVSPYTVMRELGHSSIHLIERTYGHLQEIRNRSPVVSYQVAEVVDIEEAKSA